MNAIETTSEDGQSQVQMLPEINIGLAVALDEGLVTPVIRGADGKSVAQLAAENRDLAARTRDGRTRPEEISGGTFTITNLGANDIDGFTPIINPPQVGILGVGRVVEKPIIANGEIAKGETMYLSLTFDHRVIDGAPSGCLPPNGQEPAGRPVVDGFLAGYLASLFRGRPHPNPLPEGEGIIAAIHPPSAPTLALGRWGRSPAVPVPRCRGSRGRTPAAPTPARRRRGSCPTGPG